MKRKSFFGELREKQARERLRNSFQTDSQKEELNELESSITVEDSPVKTLKKNRSLRHRFVTPSPSPKPTSNESQIIQESPSQSSEHLSSQISEFLSSQSSSSGPKTPISVWILQDQSLTKKEFVEVIESPTKQKGAGRQVNARRKVENTKPLSLLEAFMSAKSRYDSSVRLFTHDLRNGKYDESTAVNFLIRKVIDRQDKLVHTVAYDLMGNRNRFMLFKSTDPNEITEGTFLKVYPPWQEVQISGTTESLVIGTDFFKILKSSELDLTEEYIEQICKEPLPTSFDIQISEPLFMDIVPLHFKNQNTIEFSVDSLQSYMDLDVLVVEAWSTLSPSLFLLKDSDDFMSFLEVPKNNADEIITILIPGKSVMLQNIAVIEKICNTKKLAPFSVMHLYGGNQTVYYSFKWQPGSKCFEKSLDITAVKMKGDIVNIDDVYMASTHQDQRISLKCKVKEKSEDGDYILVTDNESDRSLKIEFVADINYESETISFSVDDTLLLKYVRVIYGKTIWDCFTTYEKLNEDDDLMDY